MIRGVRNLGDVVEVFGSGFGLVCLSVVMVEGNETSCFPPYVCSDVPVGPLLQGRGHDRLVLRSGKRCDLV